MTLNENLFYHFVQQSMMPTMPRTKVIKYINNLSIVFLFNVKFLTNASRDLGRVVWWTTAF